MKNEIMKELQTVLGTDIPVETRSILYLCHLEHDKITVVSERIFTTVAQGWHAYANTPNPESQLIEGSTFDELIKNMHTLHRMMKSPAWIEMLKETI